MNHATIRAWFVVHKWSSLVCTLFLLMLCVTGLPLIFHEEIDHLLAGDQVQAGAPSSGEGRGQRSLDEMLARALATRPKGEVPLYMAFDNASPVLTVTTAPRADAPVADMTLQLLNRTTGRTVEHGGDGGVMDFLLQLHTDMFLGLPGMFFLGGMGVLFVVAVVSGVVLYAPFMRKLDFGTLRTRRSKRVKWLDYHNLLGIVLVAWTLVVGLTGVINTLATPIVGAWQQGELAQMTRAYAGRPALPASRFGSLDRAMAAARAARPGNNPQFIAFPGTPFSSKHHYAVFLQGDTAMTERLLTPALVDAEHGRLTDIRPLPWYVVALELSQPLHFGDYGGMPLKILWFVLDLFTIVVLATGVWLWLARGRTRSDVMVREVTSGGLSAPAA